MSASVALAAPATTDRRASGVVNPLNPSQRIHAVLFDLDGTLYRQRPLRWLMACELMTLPISRPLDALPRWRALQAYRRAQEHLRWSAGSRSIAASQTRAAANAAGLSVIAVEQLVQEWIHQRPLKYLRWCEMPGLRTLLSFLERAGVQAGVLSDYPPREKLRALGIEERFSQILCSTDREIGALKPHPRPFLHACKQWNLAPAEVLMVGDRIDVDAAGAAAAGMPCVILGRSSRHHARRYASLPSFERLQHVLDDRR